MVIKKGNLNDCLTITISNEFKIGSIDLTILENCESFISGIIEMIPDDSPFSLFNTVYGYNFMVELEYRGKGYGVSLLGEVEKHLKSRGIKYLLMYRESNNKKLNNFYRKLNYVDIFYNENSTLFYKELH